MGDLEGIKDKLMERIQTKFEVNRRAITAKNTFYYPKYMHLLKFNVEQYEIKSLGNLAILKGKGCGIMKMLTAVFTPQAEKDIPLVIVDFIQMANKRTVFVEFYTHYITQQANVKCLEQKLKALQLRYDRIQNYTEKPNWYTDLRNVYSPLKKATSKEDDLLEEMVLDYLEVYLQCVSQSKEKLLSKNTQKETFINDLIYKGNPSQAVLEKALGKEGTEKLFKEVIFYDK